MILFSPPALSASLLETGDEEDEQVSSSVEFTGAQCLTDMKAALISNPFPSTFIKSEGAGTARGQEGSSQSTISYQSQYIHSSRIRDSRW